MFTKHTGGGVNKKKLFMSTHRHNHNFFSRIVNKVFKVLKAIYAQRMQKKFLFSNLFKS